MNAREGAGTRRLDLDAVDHAGAASCAPVLLGRDLMAAMRNEPREAPGSSRHLR
jgi:hypothetical protein